MDVTLKLCDTENGGEINYEMFDYFDSTKNKDHISELHERYLKKPHREIDFLWDPFECLFHTEKKINHEKISRSFWILANIDGLFNFSKSFGGFMAPQNIIDFYAVNATKNKDYLKYLFWRLPQSYILTLSDIPEGLHRDIKEEQVMKVKNISICETWVKNVTLHLDLVIADEETAEDVLRLCQRDTSLIVDTPSLDTALKISRLFEITYIVKPVVVPWYEKKFFVFALNKSEQMIIDEKKFKKWFNSVTSNLENFRTGDFFVFNSNIFWGIDF